MPEHLRPSAPTAPDALLCGDPSRALVIAQHVLVQPRMSNHHRGLWGYWGRTTAGAELTVQATGIGGPSAAVVLGELAGLGLRRAIRVGTCAVADASGVPLGSGLVVERAVACDGTTAALGFDLGTEIEPDPELTLALLAASGLSGGRVVSRDLHPGPDGVRGDPAAGGAEVAGATASGPSVTDLQTAAVLGCSRRFGLGAAAALAVASSAGRRLEDEPLEATLMRLAVAAVEALASTGGSP